MEDVEKKAEMLKKEVGKQIREARKRAGFSNADSAAADLEVSPTTLYELERGENWLSPDMAVRILEKWKIPLSELLAGETAGKHELSIQEALEVVAKAALRPAASAHSLNTQKHSDPLIERIKKLSKEDRKDIETTVEMMENRNAQLASETSKVHKKSV